MLDVVLHAGVDRVDQLPGLPLVRPVLRLQAVCLTPVMLRGLDLAALVQVLPELEVRGRRRLVV